jgi:hypothetical protein
VYYRSVRVRAWRTHKTAKMRKRFDQLANAGQPLSQHDQMYILTVAVARFPAATTCVVAYKIEVPRLQDRSFNEMVYYLLHHFEAYESISSVQEAGYQVAIHKMEALKRELATLKQSSAASASTTVAGTSGARHGNHQQQR